ncbi:MAG: Nif11-like leader peptide family natural product precursor [Chloroflexota bacterium]
MAAGTARLFIELLERDPKLQTQFSLKSPNTVDQILDFAALKGYIFSKDDLFAALRVLPESRIAKELRQRAH